MIYEWRVTAGLPQLDVYTLSEDWALSASLEGHWVILSKVLGRKPSDWIDSQGDRMYSAVIWLRTHFDLADPILEDDGIDCRCEIKAVRKPYSLSHTTFSVGQKKKVEVELLTAFIKRKSRGSNKKFSKTSELWRDDDVDGETIDALVDRHHEMKSFEVSAQTHGSSHMQRQEVNRIRDFNTADFMYFKNFVVVAKAAEWAKGRGGVTRLPQDRSCWYFGNVSDGDVIETHVTDLDPERQVTEHRAPDGRRIFLCQTSLQDVAIPVR